MDGPVGEVGPHPTEVGRERRRALGRRKNTADLFFLLGLVAGGPLVSFDLQPTAGLVLILSGGIASALVRYAAFSPSGALLVGVLGSITAVTGVLGPAEGGADASADTRELARTAYADELARRYESEGLLVEARGPGAVTIWFHPPAALEIVCGTFPDAPTRRHLAELGFMRIVLNVRSEDSGICSFHP